MVTNILDTLTENDFVVVYNVMAFVLIYIHWQVYIGLFFYQFTKEVKPVYPCFNHMVQATPRNIQVRSLFIFNIFYSNTFFI